MTSKSEFELGGAEVIRKRYGDPPEIVAASVSKPEPPHRPPPLYRRNLNRPKIGGAKNFLVSRTPPALQEPPSPLSNPLNLDKSKPPKSTKKRRSDSASDAAIEASASWPCFWGTVCPEYFSRPDIIAYTTCRRCYERQIPDCYTRWVPWKQQQQHQQQQQPGNESDKNNNSRTASHTPTSQPCCDAVVSPRAPPSAHKLQCVRSGDSLFPVVYHGKPYCGVTADCVLDYLMSEYCAEQESERAEKDTCTTSKVGNKAAGDPVPSLGLLFDTASLPPSWRWERWGSWGKFKLQRSFGAVK
ncbi:hypothetical protein QBC34DRAFT_417061 [Podospora aff. communis PSN243]|uniref:Uncharacterized protein n=1 Tax=Podospora aff. communis PSN243 TaxID=3040156 RepID=A0AAV9G7N6_9PEZI|nr:hypothetical protein QBC34DRAFT_417061 [Podospora aff. communis PSN243]